jgi:hypothetical protein
MDGARPVAGRQVLGGGVSGTLARGPTGQHAVGYLFDIRGRWPEPEETLEENRNDGDDPLTSAENALDTQFKTSTAKNCAKYLVGFKEVSQFGRVRYLVNNTNLGDLIQSIKTCFVP